MKTNYTHIVLLVDRSGSMGMIRDDAQGGINTLIEDQKQVDGECTISLYQFDDHYDRVYGPVHVADAPSYTLVPRGGTALLDATSRAINETGSFLFNLPEALRPSNVIFTIVTDGQENASKEVTRDKVRQMIQHQTDVYNWEFMYIGADAEAFANARAMGVNNGVQYTPTAKGIQNLYQTYSSAVTTSRLTGTAVAANMPTVVPEEEDTSVSQ